MKKMVVILLIVVSSFTCTGCVDNNEDFDTVEWVANPTNPASPLHYTVTF